jgi:hypothetical protein
VFIVALELEGTIEIGILLLLDLFLRIRTGTFFTVHIIITQLRKFYENCLNGDAAINKTKYPEINIIQTILKLREQRSGFVQTKVLSLYFFLLLLTTRINIVSFTMQFIMNIEKLKKNINGISRTRIQLWRMNFRYEVILLEKIILFIALYFKLLLEVLIFVNCAVCEASLPFPSSSKCFEVFME